MLNYRSKRIWLNTEETEQVSLWLVRGALRIRNTMGGGFLQITSDIPFKSFNLVLFLSVEWTEGKGFLKFIVWHSKEVFTFKFAGHKKCFYPSRYFLKMGKVVLWILSCLFLANSIIIPVSDYIQYIYYTSIRLYSIYLLYQYQNIFKIFTIPV